MSDTCIKDDEKKQSQSEIKNGVEKLIKIDKKHANFEFIDHLLNIKVKVRNINSSTSSSILGQNQPENTLRCFWRHINRYYFRKLDVNELERLHYLEQLYSFKQGISLPKQKYANSLLYTAIQDVFDKESYINDPKQSNDTQKILYKIIKASCNIQGLIIECHYKDKANSKFIEQIIKDRDQLYSKKNQKKKNLAELQNEYQKLKSIEDKLLKQIELYEDQNDSQPNKKKSAHQKKGNAQIKQESDVDDDNASTSSNDEIRYYAKHSSRTLETEIQKQVKQLEEVNSFNKQNLKKLSQKVQIEMKEGKLSFFENQNDSISTQPNGKQPQQQQAQQVNKQKKKSKNNNDYQTDHKDTGIINSLPKFGGFQKELGKDPRIKMSEKEINDLHQNYLQQLIFNLEEKQVADSISKITNCKKESKKEYQFEVMFEDALSSQPIYFDEKTIVRFNEYREHSMLRQYNLPIKTLFSSTSHNYVQLEQFVKNRNQFNPLKNCDVIETMKKNSHQHHDQAHYSILNMAKNFDICHHCRQIFDHGYLIKCNYRSSVMGMPSSHQSNNDQVFISQRIYLFDIFIDDKTRFLQNKLVVEYDNNQKRPFLNRKRNNYNSYTKKSSKYFKICNNLKMIYYFLIQNKDGELVCKRKFCLNCLKLNYEYKHENQSKTDWVCPFCQGYCHCIRCIRNEIINKLKGVFLLFGGDIHYLEQESFLNKYLRPLTEEEKKKRERDEYRNTNSTMIAFQAKKETYEKELQIEKDLSENFDDLTDVRLDMERVRLVVSQVCKREKLKHLKLLEEIDIFKIKQNNLQKQLNNKSNKQINVIESNKSVSNKKTNGVTKNKNKINSENINKNKKQQNKNSKNKKIEQEESDHEKEDERSETSEEERDQDNEEEITEGVEIQESEKGSQDSSEDDSDKEEVSSTNQSESQQINQLSDEEDENQDEDDQVSEEENEDESINEEDSQSNKDDSDDDNEEEESQISQSEDEEDQRKSKVVKSKMIPKPISTKNIQKIKTKSKSEISKQNKQKNKKQMNGKLKYFKKEQNKKQNKEIKKNDKKKIQNKFIKRTKKSAQSMKDILNSNIVFKKEIQNLIRNQDPSILQLTTQEEKALRSNMIPLDNHQDQKKQFQNIGLPLIQKNNKQSLSKFEHLPKKKLKK